LGWESHQVFLHLQSRFHHWLWVTREVRSVSADCRNLPLAVSGLDGSCFGVSLTSAYMTSAWLCWPLASLPWLLKALHGCSMWPGSGWTAPRWTFTYRTQTAANETADSTVMCWHTHTQTNLHKHPHPALLGNLLLLR